MATIVAVGHLGATFSAKLRNFVKDSDIDHTLIDSQSIVFYRPNGTNFKKSANLEVDPINPSQVIALSNIVGDGIEDVITVTVPATNKLKNGELITISSTTNFNVSKVPLTIVDATTFTYKLGAVGNVSSEATGNVTTQGEKLIVYQNITAEGSILDVLGKWQFAAEVVLTNGNILTTRDRVIFWVQ